jgi:hypothetical protein
MRHQYRDEPQQAEHERYEPEHDLTRLLERQHEQERQRQARQRVNQPLRKMRQYK